MQKALYVIAFKLYKQAELGNTGNKPVKTFTHTITQVVALEPSVHQPAGTLSATFIADYLAAEGETVLQSVGAYQIEGRGAQLFAGLRGDFFSILGLPLLPLLGFLRGHGVVPA